MAKYGDIIVGALAILYAILAGILLETDIADLGQYIAQPKTAGAFGMVALGRGYKDLMKLKKAALAKAGVTDDAPDET